MKEWTVNTLIEKLSALTPEQRELPVVREVDGTMYPIDEINIRDVNEAMADDLDPQEQEMVELY